MQSLNPASGALAARRGACRESAERASAQTVVGQSRSPSLADGFRGRSAKETATLDASSDSGTQASSDDTDHAFRLSRDRRGGRIALRRSPVTPAGAMAAGAVAPAPQAEPRHAALERRGFEAQAFRRSTGAADAPVRAFEDGSNAVDLEIHESSSAIRQEFGRLRGRRNFQLRTGRDESPRAR